MLGKLPKLGHDSDDSDEEVSVDSDDEVTEWVEVSEPSSAPITVDSCFLAKDSGHGLPSIPIAIAYSVPWLLYRESKTGSIGGCPSGLMKKVNE